VRRRLSSSSGGDLVPATSALPESLLWAGTGTLGKKKANERTNERNQQEKGPSQVSHCKPSRKPSHKPSQAHPARLFLPVLGPREAEPFPLPRVADQQLAGAAKGICPRISLLVPDRFRRTLSRTIQAAEIATLGEWARAINVPGSSREVGQYMYVFAPLLTYFELMPLFFRP
jgi:hypothetical protein